MRIAIIGAGAAGCFAAANISNEQGREVIIFEKSGKALQKVKVSGGGRCNVTHACFDVPDLLSRYPRGQRFLRKTLFAFTTQDTMDWFRERGVQLKTEEDGRVFPVSDDSQTIIDAIWHSSQRNKTEIRYHKAVEHIERQDGTFVLHFKDGSTYRADRVLIATGGFPKPEQYKWILELGHTIQQPVPSLFTFNIPGHPITELMGVSINYSTVKIQGSKISSTGPVLITHWGLSGPAVLRCSAWAARELSIRNYKFVVLINWLGDISEHDIREQIVTIRQGQGKLLVSNKNPFGLPKRLWEYILKKCSIFDGVKWGELSAKGQNLLISSLVNDEYHISGKTTFKEEFVTCGGVNLSEVDPKTMESRLVPGLFFAGEIMDVDGITGGFNFQHAWSSGYIAASNIINEQ